MANQLRGGLIQIAVDGALFAAKGDFTIDLGGEKRTAIVGSDGGVHGYSVVTVAPSFEGAITLNDDVTPGYVRDITDATAIVSEASGRTTVFRGAFYAGDSKWTTNEGEMAIRFEAVEAKEI